MSYPVYRLVETTPPAEEPLGVADVKAFLRIDHDDDDTLLAELIAAARQICETATGRSLVTRSYSFYLDAWPEKDLALPRPPLASVVAINVYAADDSSAVFSSDNYHVEDKGAPGRIVLKEGAVQPTPGRTVNGIEVQYTAGYGAAAEDVPPLLRVGMKQLVAHLYTYRGDAPVRALFGSGAAAIFYAYRTMEIT